MSKTKTAAINYAASGSTVKGAIALLDAEFDLVYGFLNTLYKQQYGDSEPTDKNTGDIWIDSLPSPRFMIYDGANFVPMVQRILGQSAAPSGPNDNDLWHDPDPQAILKYYNATNTAWVNLTYGLPIGLFHAYASNGSVTFNTATLTTILHDTEVADPCAWYAPATGRYTPQLAGWYEIHASIALDSDTATFDGELAIAIAKNGAHVASVNQILKPTDAALNSIIQVSAMIEMNGTTDYITAVGYQKTVGAGNIANQTGKTHDNAFWGRFLGASQTGTLL